MENHHFQWVNPLQMAIFNSYVKLPEGIDLSFVYGLKSSVSLACGNIMRQLTTQSSVIVCRQTAHKLIGRLAHKLVDPGYHVYIYIYYIYMDIYTYTYTYIYTYTYTYIYVYKE